MASEYAYKELAKINDHLRKQNVRLEQRNAELKAQLNQAKGQIVKLKAVQNGEGVFISRKTHNAMLELALTIGAIK